MKTKIIFFLVLALAGMNAMGQTANRLNSNIDDSIQSTFDVRQLSISKWDAVEGIPYSQVPGANLGATSFAVLKNNRVSYLCNASNEIIVVDMLNGKAIKRFPLAFAPRDFVCENELFFVLAESRVIVYDSNGTAIKYYTFPQAYSGTERIARYNNATYLLLSSGNSLKLEEGGIAITAQEQEGWATATGNFIKTQLYGDQTYLIKVIPTTGNSFSKLIKTDKKVAGVFVVGTSANRVVLDVQTYISENPISVERFIVSVDLKQNGLGAIISSIKVPDCYYVLCNKEFDLSSDGGILHNLSSPQGTYLFLLSETKSNLAKGYPASVTSTKYHFNDHLIELGRNN